VNPLNIEVTHVLVALAQVVLGILVLVIARLAKGVLSPYRMDDEMTAKDNPAFGLAIAGYYLAAVAIYIGAARAAPLPVDAGTAGLVQTLAVNLGWTMGGIVALAFSRWVMDAALVSGARCSDEIVRNRNLAAGAVECGVYVASGIVLAGASREPGGSVVTALVFFLLSQIVLLLFGRLYQAWAGYGIAREIRSGNLAAGAAFGLTLIALSLLMLKATSGEFIDWSTNLAFFAFDAVIGFGLLMLLRWVTDLALLPNARIANEIVQDRNTNVGLLEGVIAVAVALLILFVF
jgi:uncharacterized membrane protein YjfL (UPF0719 family)